MTDCGAGRRVDDHRASGIPGPGPVAIGDLTGDSVRSFPVGEDEDRAAEPGAQQPRTVGPGRSASETSRSSSGIETS